MANLNLISFLSKQLSSTTKSTKLRTGVKTNIVKTSKCTREIHVSDQTFVGDDGTEHPVFSPNSPVYRPFYSESSNL